MLQCFGRPDEVNMLVRIVSDDLLYSWLIVHNELGRIDNALRQLQRRKSCWNKILRILRYTVSRLSGGNG